MTSSKKENEEKQTDKSNTINIQRFRQFWMPMHNYVSPSMVAKFHKTGSLKVIIPNREQLLREVETVKCAFNFGLPENA